MSKENKTKEKIVHVANRIVSDQGFSYLNVSNLCDEAKITKPTFYYYYESKEDIFLQQKILLSLDDATLMDIITHENAWEQICILINSILSQLLDKYGQNVVQTILSLHMLNGELPFKNTIETYLPILTSFVSKAQSEHIIRNTSSPKELAETLLYNVYGLTYLSISNSVHGNIYDIVRQSTENICNVNFSAVLS